MTDAEAAGRLQELLARMDESLGSLEAADDSEDAVDRLAELAELAREVQAEIDRLRREGEAEGPGDAAA